jgi:hypothetical protein
VLNGRAAKRRPRFVGEIQIIAIAVYRLVSFALWHDSVFDGFQGAGASGDYTHD